MGRCVLCGEKAGLFSSEHPECRLAHNGSLLCEQHCRYRWLHGGFGNRGFPETSSSGQTTTCLPSCHWMAIALWSSRSVLPFPLCLETGRNWYGSSKKCRFLHFPKVSFGRFKNVICNTGPQSKFLP